MKFYVQYAEDGTITGTVLSSGAAPAREGLLQLAFDQHVSVDGKRVDTVAKELVPCPIIAKQRHNESILMQLKAIDEKSVRAMRDFYLTGDKTALENLETAASALRTQFLE